MTSTFPPFKNYGMNGTMFSLDATQSFSAPMVMMRRDAKFLNTHALPRVCSSPSILIIKFSIVYQSSMINPIIFIFLYWVSHIAAGVAVLLTLVTYFSTHILTTIFGDGGVEVRIVAENKVDTILLTSALD